MLVSPVISTVYVNAMNINLDKDIAFEKQSAG